MNKKLAFAIAVVLGSTLLQTQIVSSQTISAARARDPGVRGGAPGAGNPLTGLTANELITFTAGKLDFAELEEVADGLGPTMNLDGCGGCHAQPSVGGSSPAVNPQVAFARKLGANNSLPSFIRANGPIREARFVKNADGTPDGGVHAVFTIAGRSDAPGCRLAQPDFATHVRNDNVIFRIPTPLFGAGLIEQIPDSTILANQAADASLKQPLGIAGRANTVTGMANTNGNDGTVARFGWKAQNKSLLLFSGEAYSVEMGISNELFQQERDETAGCQFATVPNDVFDSEATAKLDLIPAIQKFSIFQRFLAPPTPSVNTPGGSDSIQRGKAQFTAIGCALCHTATLRTGNSTVAALRNKNANLYSDLLLHDMGPGLSDRVSQGRAGPAEFRTAPLWGVGQRVFFLHDGRTSDLQEAIAAHESGSTRTGDASEASEVARRFNGLNESLKQDVLNFLRSL
jgi:CxxC motif-containing protein (DUF1111 family)